MEGTKQSNIAKRETTLYTKKHILYSYIPSAACYKKGLGVCLMWSPLPLPLPPPPLPPKRKKTQNKTKIDPQFNLFFLKEICFFMQWIRFQIPRPNHDSYLLLVNVLQLQMHLGKHQLSEQGVRIHLDFFKNIF